MSINAPVPVSHHQRTVVHHHILKDVGDDVRQDISDDFSHIVKNSRHRVHQHVYRKRIIHAQSPIVVLCQTGCICSRYMNAVVLACGGLPRVFFRPGYYVHLFRCAVFWQINKWIVCCGMPLVCRVIFCLSLKSNYATRKYCYSPICCIGNVLQQQKKC